LIFYLPHNTKRFSNIAATLQSCRLQCNVAETLQSYKMQIFNSNVAAILQKHGIENIYIICNSADVTTIMKEIFKYILINAICFYNY